VPEPSSHHRLTALGWDDRFADALGALSAAGEPAIEPGRVSRVDRGGTMTVETAGGALRARMAPHFRREADPTALPAVGDWAVVRSPADGGAPSVEAVLPRRTAFVRRAAGQRTAVQVLAANVDSALLVCSLAGALNPGRLERLLALTWDSGAEPVVVLSQADRCADVAAAVVAAGSVAIGVPVHPVSAVTGEGLAALGPYLRTGAPPCCSVPRGRASRRCATGCSAATCSPPRRCAATARAGTPPATGSSYACPRGAC
jgi:ribosome biogenesis GTPase